MARIHNGEWRSLVARFVRDEEVPGSNPGSPTIPVYVVAALLRVASNGGVQSGAVPASSSISPAIWKSLSDSPPTS